MEVKGLAIFYIDVDMLQGDELDSFMRKIKNEHQELTEEIAKTGYRTVFLKTRTGNGDRLEYMPLP